MDAKKRILQTTDYRDFGIGFTSGFLTSAMTTIGFGGYENLPTALFTSLFGGFMYPYVFPFKSEVKLRSQLAASAGLMVGQTAYLAAKNMFSY